MGKEENSQPPKDTKAADANAKKEDKKDDDKNKATLTEQDIALLKRYGRGPYAEPIKKAEEEIKEFNQKITTLTGIKESDTGLALPAQWNLQQDQMMLKQDPSL